MTMLTVDIGGEGKAVLTATPASSDDTPLLDLAAQDNAGLLRHFLASVATWHAEAQQERDDSGWVLHIPGTGLVANGETFDAAIDDLIGDLREYADDWAELRSAPNHRDNLGSCSLSLSALTLNSATGCCHPQPSPRADKARSRSLS